MSKRASGTNARGAITSGILSDTLISKAISYIIRQLPVWRDDPSRRDEQSENQLNLQLVKHLDAQARRDFPMVRFDHEEYQGRRRSVDISASPTETIIIDAKQHTIYDPFLVIEGKRLPAPSSDRETEYVSGGIKKASGGIQRFKLDELVKSLQQPLSVIPVKTGIQFFQLDSSALDTRFCGYDDFLRGHQTWSARQ